jgi:hypothetical protein
MTTTLARSRRAVAVAVVGGVVIVAAVIFWRVTGEEDLTVPYDDAQSAGSITLCSADGKSVTEGRLDDQPFAAVVLGETALPSDLDPAGAVATLFAYQPRAGVGTSEYSGNALTAAAAFADPSRPAARVEDNAWSIGDFVTAFPADDDGYVQLRLLLGTPGAGTLSDQPYDTADLRVDGDRWELVRGGTASCADATSALLP